MLELQKDKYSKRTINATAYAERLLKQFTSTTKTDISKAENTEICQLLCGFYSSLRKDDGENLCVMTLRNIRYGIARYMKQTRNMDILKDSKFLEANDVFDSKTAHLKKLGKGTIKHYDIISEEDLKKIGNLNINSPTQLQLKVWFTIQYHYARRGMENIHDMKKSDITLKHMPSGKLAFQLRDCATKNHHGADVSKFSEAIIVETGTVDCPVQIIRCYIDRLCENEYMWQRPKNNITSNDQRWYENAKIGINTVAKMMAKISEVLKLSKVYSNHCVRATAITTLGKSFGDIDIQSVSGHKSLNALSIYKRTSEQRLEEMSNDLHKHVSSSDLTQKRKRMLSNFNTTETCKEMLSNFNCTITVEDNNITETRSIPKDTSNSQSSEDEESTQPMSIEYKPQSIPSNLLTETSSTFKNSVFNNCKLEFHIHNPK